MSNNADAQTKAIKEFNVANQLASDANEAAQYANTALGEYKEKKERLDNWKSIMSTAPVVLFTIIFVIVSIGEYLISKEIYREFNDELPWAIAIVFFVAGIFASEFLVYKLFKQKREWKRYELKRDANNNDKTDDEIDYSIKKITQNNFIFGLILSILLVSAIGFLSYKRVQGELGAGMRESGFGIMDIMPMLLYVVEIVSGVFIMYLLKQIGLTFKVNGLWKKFNAEVLKCNRLTSTAIKKYQDAEKENFDPFAVQVSDNMHTAFYRNKMFTLDDKERYVALPVKMDDVFNLQLVDENGNPLSKHVSIITDYKFHESGSTDAAGRLALHIEKTFPKDSCRDIFIRNTADATDFKKVNGVYDLDVNKTHKIIIGK